MTEEGTEATPGPAAADRHPTAAGAGRLAGRVVTGLGLRLLRVTALRRTIRRAAEEASEEPRRERRPD